FPEKMGFHHQKCCQRGGYFVKRERFPSEEGIKPLKLESWSLKTFRCLRGAFQSLRVRRVILTDFQEPSIFLYGLEESINAKIKDENCTAASFVFAKFRVWRNVCPKHQRKWKSTVNSTVMARGTDGIDTILQPTIFMKQKRMSKEVSRESTCPHVSLIVYISVTYHVVSLCTPAGSVSENGMLYTGVKKLETVMVDAVCFSTFTSFLIVQS
ncbi:hypothetical protein HID58_007398, partial [Brassica napus]